MKITYAGLLALNLAFVFLNVEFGHLGLAILSGIAATLMIIRLAE